MSEEILKALAQLYAIITKQDGGVTDKEREFVCLSFRKKLSLESAKQYISLYDEYTGYHELKLDSPLKEEKLTSVKDSVKTLAICKKINKTLTQKQKIVVLVELLEMVKTDGNPSPQRMQIIYTVAESFNIEREEYKNIENLILQNSLEKMESEEVLIITNETKNTSKSRQIISDQIEGMLLFIRVKSCEMIFMKYIGQDEIFLNGIICEKNSISLVSNGSTIKTKLGGCFYYSEILSNFLSELREVKLSIKVDNIEFKFPNNHIGLRNINLSEGPGKLIGIMGASGAGKTTLLNVLAGLEKPSSGEVLINGINIHNEKQKVQGVIGYVAQDDLLIEELTVFQNLYYNTKLCFKDLSEIAVHKLIDKVLNNLGLLHIKDIQVGNVLNKTISGGQRKRLNIALELIREPSVLYVDEPTSGLSSRDSENVIDLLKELSLKGTLIFVVIHQPSSDIYKMFDKMYILDTGGYLIFNGHPVEAVSYFKKMSHQADCEHGLCQSCGNVNPEQIFNIIEEKVVDEYGTFTSQRKINPVEWNEYYKNNFKLTTKEELTNEPLKLLKLPSKIKQWVIFTTRDLKSKLSNKQYLIINFLEAPLLALILAFIIRYNNDPSGSKYSFRYNENLPAYILMSIVVALFMGLSVSAEEIIKDKKILKRESFLNLSRSSYLFSKVFILFLLSAIQTLTFVWIGNTILEIRDMNIAYWLVLFSTSCMANMLGLSISSAFNTPVTVYIMIPLLLIPQMILSGAMFNYDKINDLVNNKEKVPVVADLMASRWAFEALAVEQFINNKYEAPMYQSEQVESIASFRITYLLPELNEITNYLENNYASKNDSISLIGSRKLEILKNELIKQSEINKNIHIEQISKLSFNTLSSDKISSIRNIISELESAYQSIYKNAEGKKEQIINSIADEKSALKLKDEYYNESLSDLVRSSTAKKRIIEGDNILIAKTDPIFFNPENIQSLWNYRAHLFAPNKQFMGIYINTFLFNLIVIWLLTALLYFALYFELLRKLITQIESLKIKKS